MKVPTTVPQAHVQQLSNQWQPHLRLVRPMPGFTARRCGRATAISALTVQDDVARASSVKLAPLTKVRWSKSEEFWFKVVVREIRYSRSG